MKIEAINLKELQRQIWMFAKSGYAGGKPGNIQEDGSTLITYRTGLWTGDDQFYRGDPSSGATTMFYDGHPVWRMSYYGNVMEEILDIGPVYRFLRNALAEVPEACPFRGPERVIDGRYLYRNVPIGDIKKIRGVEWIEYRRQKVFSGIYIGGLIDLRPYEEAASLFSSN